MANNEYYDHTTYPSTGADGSSSAMRAELNSIEAGFDKLPTLAGNGGKIIAVNAGGTAEEAITTTGTGSGVRATSPTLVTPILGTPASGVTDNLTTTTTATAITDTDFVDTNLAAGGKRKILWTAVKTYLTSTFSTLAQLAAAGGAALVGNTPAGSIAGTTVQAAINELDTEKAALPGSASQTFSVAAASSAAHAVRYDQTALSCAFAAYLSASQSDKTGDGTGFEPIFDAEVLDVGANYNNATGVFTAPAARNYRFSWGVYLDQLVAGTSGVFIYLITSNYTLRLASLAGGTYYTPTGSMMLPMDAGDTAYVSIIVTGGAKTVDVLGSATQLYTFFSGEMV